MRMLWNPIIKIFCNLFIGFFCPLPFDILDHNILTSVFALLFGLAAPTRRTAVLFLTSNNLVNRRNDFLALGFLIVTEGPDYIGMFSVNLTILYH